MPLPGIAGRPDCVIGNSAPDCFIPDHPCVMQSFPIEVSFPTDMSCVCTPDLNDPKELDSREIEKRDSYIHSGEIEKDCNDSNPGHSPSDVTLEDSANSRNSDAIDPLPSGGTSLSSALPCPACSRKSRRRRAPITDTLITPCDYDSSWSDKKCDYDFSWSDKKSYCRESSCLNKKSDRVHRECSCSARSDYTAPLGLDSARSCRPTVHLGLCSTRSLTANPTCELSRDPRWLCLPLATALP